MSRHLEKAILDSRELNLDSSENNFDNYQKSKFASKIRDRTKNADSDTAFGFANKLALAYGHPEVNKYSWQKPIQITKHKED